MISDECDYSEECPSDVHDMGCYHEPLPDGMREYMGLPMQDAINAAHERQRWARQGVFLRKEKERRNMIPDEAVEAALAAWGGCPVGTSPKDQVNRILESAAPYILNGDVEWTVFRESDGTNGSPAENLRYSTKAGAQESIDTRYGTPELWEPRRRIVGEWTK